MARKRTIVEILCGQGDADTSWGMLQMRDAIKAWKDPLIETRLNWWHEWQAERAWLETLEGDFNLACLLYSMGGNAGTWLIGGLNYNGIVVPPIRHKVDIGIWLDPTWLSIISPMSFARVAQVVHVYNTNLVDPEGHGELTFTTTPTAPEYIRYNQFTEHLLVDKLPGNQQMCLSAIRTLAERAA